MPIVDDDPTEGTPQGGLLMSTRRILALLVVLTLSFALLPAMAGSATQANVSVTDQGTAPPVAFRDDGDGGDDDRWGDTSPYDPEDPDPEGEGEGDDEEPEGGEVQGGDPKAFETIRMQLSNILWRLRLMLAAL
jgi:hypothetical protein